MTRARRRWGLALGAAVLVVLLVGGRWAALETAERAWASSLPAGTVYVAARDVARLISGLILLLAIAWGTGNVYFVYRAIGSVQLPRRLGDLEIVEAVPQRVLLGGMLASGLVFGFLLAIDTGDWWMSFLLASDPPRFGIADPLLHRDLGYYVGQLPWSRRVQGFALLATVTASMLVALLYLGIGSLRFHRWRPHANAHARAHLGLLFACTAFAVTWGAVLDPAETVGGLHGALDRNALQLRLPGASVVAALAVAAAVASLVWALRERPMLLLTSWVALLGASSLVYLVLPGLMRHRAGEAEIRLADERPRLEGLAFASLGAENRPPPALSSAAAAVTALPVWDAQRVAAAVAARQPDLLGPRTAVAGAALSRSGPDGSRASWLVAANPDLGALARTQPVPTWTEIHRGPWARVGPPLAVVEADGALEFAPRPVGDPVWFGPGFSEFAVAAADSWPAARASGVPLVGWWRRTALAWSLQSPELTRAETDGLVLLWRRDVVERLERLAPFATFDAPVPLLANGTLWWVAYGYLVSEAFPLARRQEWRGRTVRYLRAGLVGAVNAESGDTRLSLAPGADSLAAAWARIFTPLLQPLDSLPASVRAALPYPHQAFRLAAAIIAQPHADSVGWTPRPRESFELATPTGSNDGERQLWTGQAFEAGTPRGVVALVAGAIGPAGPQLFVWRPNPTVRLPSVLVGSPQPSTAPGVLRLWNVGGTVFSEQALFREPGPGGTPASIDTVFVTWGERRGQGPTPTAALRNLMAAGRTRLAGDTSLGARWEEARRLAALADAALAAGDLETFGRYYRQLKDLLELGHGKLAPVPGPR